MKRKVLFVSFILIIGFAVSIFLKPITVNSKYPSCFSSVNKDGNAEVTFNFLNCEMDEKYKTFIINPSYIDKCNIVKYDEMFGFEINHSNRSELSFHIQMKDIGIETNENIFINLGTKFCNQKDNYYNNDYYVDITKKKISKQNDGINFYSKAEKLNSNLKLYKALTKKPYFEYDVYIYEDTKNKDYLVAECNDKICKSEIINFLNGYVVNYRFPVSEVLNLSVINKNIQNYLIAKFK